MLGKTISHYKVLEKIGQGGRGEVLRAEDSKPKGDVAIEVPPKQFTRPQTQNSCLRLFLILAVIVLTTSLSFAGQTNFAPGESTRFLAAELGP